MKKEKAKYVNKYWDLSLIKDYVINPDKFVYPLVIHEKTKDRTIITYMKENKDAKQLRAFHRYILQEFTLNFYDRNESSFAYHKGVKCLDALKAHLKSNCFIKLDIHHFFESISEDKFFEINEGRFNKRWTDLLKGCFYKGHLSIGFVTSPLISDFFMIGFDTAINEYIKDKPYLHYSRYSDDILLSSEQNEFDDLEALFEFVKEKLKELDFEINEKKTQKMKLDLSSHNSFTFLGLNLSKVDDINNKITISKHYILFLLFLIEKSLKYHGKIPGLKAEIKSRVNYLSINSDVSYQRFLKKFKNKFGFDYIDLESNYKASTFKNTTKTIPDFDSYAKDFKINIHAKVIKEKNKVVLCDCIQLEKYIGQDKDVIVPPFIESIGKNAFLGTQTITSVSLPEGLKAIDNLAFSSCFNLETINLPSSLIYIAPSAFVKCSKLSSICIPEKIDVLYEKTFANCSGLTSVTFNKSLKKIHNSCFAHCDSLEIIDLRDTQVEMIGSGAFSYCKKLSKFMIDGLNLTTLKADLFLDCTNLEWFDVSNIMTFESGVFKGCHQFTTIKIPSSAKQIAQDAFDFGSVESISVDPNNPVYDSRNNCNAVVETATNKIIIACNKTIIDDSIEAIGPNAFEKANIKGKLDLRNVKEVGSCAFRLSNIVEVVGLHVEKIGICAFESSKNLSKVTFGSNLKTIEASAFSGNSEIKEIELPDSLNTIGDSCFKDTSLRKIVIGPNVSVIGDDAFFTPTLDEIVVDNANKVYDSRNNCNCLIETKKNTILTGGNNSFIPSGIKVIAQGAFQGKKHKNIEITYGVNVVGERAFASMPNLEEVVISTSVTSIENYAFYFDEKLIKINLPDSIVSLGQRVFTKCSSLKELSFPNSLNDIPSYCCESCSSLEKITLPTGIRTIMDSAFADTNIKTIHFPKTLVSFDSSAFSNVPYLEDITVDENNPKFYANSHALYQKSENDVKCLTLGTINSVIDKDTDIISVNAFKGRKGLTDIVIPPSVSMIQDSAFFGTSLKTITISKNVTSIKPSSFANIVTLDHINVDKENKAYTSNDKDVLIDREFKQWSSTKNDYLLTACNNSIIDETILGIDNVAFLGAVNLKELHFGPSITNLNDIRLTELRSIEKITINQNNPLFADYSYNGIFQKYSDNIILSRTSNTLIRASNSLTTIPEFIVNVSSSAFMNLKSIKKIVIPGNIKEPFFDITGCESLESIVFEEGVEDINVISHSKHSSYPRLKLISLPSTCFAFNTCGYIEDIKDSPLELCVDSNNKYFSIVDGKVYPNNAEINKEKAKKGIQINQAFDDDLIF